MNVHKSAKALRDHFFNQLLLMNILPQDKLPLWWDGSLTGNDLTTNCTANEHWSSFKPNRFLSVYMVGLKAITLSSITNHREKEGRKEGNVLFNDALNTFYLRLYGIRHMVKDHTDSERGNPHGLLFPNSSKCSFICIIPQTGKYIQWPLLYQSWSTGWNEK